MVGKIPEVKVKLVFDSKAKAELKSITKEISDAFKHSPQLKEMIKSLDSLQIATHRLEIAMRGNKNQPLGVNLLAGMESSDYFKELQKTLEDVKNQDQRDLFGSLERKLEEVAKTIAQAVSKVGGKGGTTTIKQGLTFEEQMQLGEQKIQKELITIQERQKGDEKRYKMREALSDKEEEGRVSRQANRGWTNMMGGSGSMLGQLSKVLEPVMKKAFKPMQEVFEYNEFTKTKEGQEAEKMKYMTGGNPFSNMMGEKKFQAAGIADSDSARKSSGGILGGLKNLIGGKSKQYQKGGLMGMMGGKKGMAMLGGALIGVAMIKKGVQLAIASSPMMQQMLKLWKFGIMMIFRPLGDFFGFFLRPIFVYMLRKFIIPFYQTFLPLMQQLGMDIGETVVGWLEWIFGGIDILTGWSKTAHQDALVAEGKLDIGTATLLDTSQLIKEAIDKGTDATKASLGNWEKFRDELFPDQEVKGMDVEGIGTNLPLTQEAIDWYRNMNILVTPAMKNSKGKDSVFDSGASEFSDSTRRFSKSVDDIIAGTATKEGAGLDNARGNRGDNNTFNTTIEITTTADPEEIEKVLEDKIDHIYQKTLNKRGRN